MVNLKHHAIIELVDQLLDFLDQFLYNKGIFNDLFIASDTPN